MTDLTVQPITAEMKDFSRSMDPIQFRIDNDVFHAPARIPAQTLIEFTRKFEGLGEDSDISKTIEAFMSTIELVLLPDSAELFKRRMGDKTNPISMDQVNDVVPWLMEQYGLRPTQSSEDSSDGQPNPESGTPSTETQLVEVSTSPPSTPTDS